MAQPTHTPEHFEVSEPTAALPVPALSRYRHAAETAADKTASSPKAEAANRAAPSAAGAPADETTEHRAEPAAPADTVRATRTHTPIDPIVQPASDEWATDPSPPQPVRDARSSLVPSRVPARHESPRGRDEGDKRRPFWKRLAMGRPAPASDPSHGSAKLEIPPDLLKPAIERIDHLTRRFEREQKALQKRLDEFEHNLTRLWELEEQMGMEEIRAQLAVMRANQEEIADGLHNLARRVTIAAGAVVATIAAILIWAAL